MKLRYTLLAAVLLGCVAPAAAQFGNIYLPDSAIRVMQHGQRRFLAWAGGFNSTQFVNADLNNDGLQDIVAYEWRERSVRTFINRGTASAAAYRYEPRYQRSFPDCYDYIKMPDYNRDGIPDLIHKGIGGFAVFRGYYNAANELNFTFYRDLRFLSPAFGDINAYSQSSDIPGIADVDGDGDLDFFGYDVQGGIVGFYKNCQVEQKKPKDSIVICNPTNCWGHMYQGFERTYQLGLVASPTSATCRTLGNFGCKGCDAAAEKTARHAGNCMLIFDYDGDGDMDFLDGNISFPDLQLLINGRAQHGGTDSMTRQDTLWQSGGHRLHLPNWPSPNLADWDGDGKSDLLITPHDYSGENYRCVHLYRNTGTAASPAFTFSSDTAFVDQTIDMGSNSVPVLYDYNRDGRLDLFIGSEGFYQPNGSFRSRLAYYQNSRSGNVTTLTLTDPDVAGIFADNVAGSAPAFGDINGDGKDDMVIGHTDGRLRFYTNIAGSNSVQPQWVLDQVFMKDAAGDTIDVGFSATPYIYDLNKDGKPDLLVGNQSGRIAYYQNNSTGGLNLSLVNARLGDVKANAANTFSGFSSIWIGKMDVSGAEYMVLGNDLGNVVRYTGFQGGNTTATYSLVTANYSGIDIGSRSAVTIGDLDGDGMQEMIIGNSLGGVSLFKRGPVVGIAEGPGSTAGGLVISPNPATNTILVSWPPMSASSAMQLRLINAVGQTVRTMKIDGSAGATRLSLEALPAGVYLCQVQSPSFVLTSKLIVAEG